MNAKTFFDKVSLMRQAQREYFSTRDHSALRRSKALEAEIDAEIKRVNGIMGGRQQPPTQPTLFP